MKLHELFEAVTLDLAELTDKINTFTKIGEITKRDYDDLKYNLNRAIEKATNPIKEKFLYGKGRELDEIDPALGELAWHIPSSYIEIASLKNHLKKAKGIDHPIVTVLQDFYDKNIKMVEDFKALKDKIVTAAQKRQEVKAAKAVENKKKFTDSASLVNELMKDIEEYEQKAFDVAGEQYEYWMSVLEKADWDLNVAAPSPESKMEKGAYTYAQQRRERLRSMSDYVSAKETNIRKASPSKKSAFQVASKQAAHDSYIAWIDKMIDKIGSPVAKAEAKGNPWTGSTLKVITIDGDEQVWNTQMIINRSKYDALFNQFPSRRKK